MAVRFLAAGLAAAALLATPALARDCGGASATFTPAAYQGHGNRGAAPAAAGDIVDVAQGAGQFQTLLAAATAAGLVDTLKSPGPFTVFAPTDAAFARLPAGTVQTLLRPENRDQLRAILLYHVVPGRVTAASLSGQTVAPVTAQGAVLAVDGRTGVQVNDARVVTADVAASNGIIHVIDRVLMPPMRTEAAAAAPAPRRTSH